MDQQTSTPTKPKQNDNSIANDAVLYFPQTPKKTGAELHRNEYFCKTLRKRSSHESLLSLNKPLNKPNGLGIENVNNNISSTRKERRQSKNLYYVVRDEAKDFNMNTSSSSSLVSHKRSSLMNYCTNQLHKVSPRPKSSIMFWKRDIQGTRYSLKLLTHWFIIIHSFIRLRFQFDNFQPISCYTLICFFFCSFLLLRTVHSFNI